jgi:crotonobetainyl-CoA:carnitine CoA-transferase CaiB-like acyl-CoA transferase
VQEGWRQLVQLAQAEGKHFLDTVSEEAHVSLTGWLRPLFTFSDSQLTPAATFSPSLGQHTDEILTELGVTAAQIAELRTQRVIL